MDMVVLEAALETEPEAILEAMLGFRYAADLRKGRSEQCSVPSLLLAMG